MRTLAIMIEYSVQAAAIPNNLPLQLRLFLLAQSRQMHIYQTYLCCALLQLPPILCRLWSNHLSQLFAGIVSTVICRVLRAAEFAARGHRNTLGVYLVFQ